MEEHLLETPASRVVRLPGAVCAAAVRLSAGGVVEEARIVLGAVASRPLVATEAAKSLLGRPLDREAIEQAATLAARLAKPLDNTDFNMSWRKKAAAEFVTYALRELRGDDARPIACS